MRRRESNLPPPFFCVAKMGADGAPHPGGQAGWKSNAAVSRSPLPNGKVPWNM